MNVLPANTQLYALNLLLEGSSIRSTSRLTGVHRDTIGRLQYRAGLAAEALMAERVYRVKTLHSVQVDELWSYALKKKKHVRPGDPVWAGDQWVWLGLDRDTKLIAAAHTGPRSKQEAVVFLHKLKRALWTRPRLNWQPHHHRPQLITDGWRPYPEVVRGVFGSMVRHGVMVKQSHREPHERERMTCIQRCWLDTGEEDSAVGTSHIERANGTMRNFCRRLHRKTLGFSKRADRLQSAVALQVAWYNFCWEPRTLGTTPAVAAGVADGRWEMGRLVEELAAYDQFGF